MFGFQFLLTLFKLKKLAIILKIVLFFQTYTYHCINSFLFKNISFYIPSYKMVYDIKLLKP